jgi:hypothetical protein
MEITSVTATTASTTNSASTQGTATASFAAELAATTRSEAASSAAEGKADFVSGRIGIDLDRRGVPSAVVYFDESGNKLRASIFTAENILKYTKQFGIDLNDLKGLGAQLDGAGVGYRPYELYKGTGSDHGVNFDDLIVGGMGSAYDWTQDANVAEKGARGLALLEEAKALASELGVEKHLQVTQERGIDPAYFEPLAGRGEKPRDYVLFNGEVASWYRTADAASSAAGFYGGSVINLAQQEGSTAISPSDETARLIALLQSASAAGTAGSSPQTVLDSLRGSLTG